MIGNSLWGKGARLLREDLVVMAQVVFNEGGDEIVRVVVALKRKRKEK